MRRGVAIAMVLGLALWGCSDDGSEAPVEEVDAPAEAEAQDQEEEKEERVGELFGLPVPADYVNLRMEEDEAKVIVEKSLEELELFFMEEAVDYEVVYRPPYRMDLVPLRTGMAGLEARRLRSSDIPVELTYMAEAPDLSTYQEQREQRSERQEQRRDRTDRNVARERQRQATFMRRSRSQWMDRQRGEPVELETAEGEPLAPGARWGEPYTPPAGSPLDQERYRANFGRPFGEWSAH